jgi:parallel beta-helix repeat protein
MSLYERLSFKLKFYFCKFSFEFPFLTGELVMFKLKLLIGAALVSCAVGAQARDLYVGCGAAASDANTIATVNSEARPYATPRAANADALPGDTINFVGNCTFGSFTIDKSGTPNAYITWKAAAGATPTITVNTDKYAAISVYAAYIRISGLTLVGRNQEVTLDAATANNTLVNESLPWNAVTNPKRDPENPIFHGNGIQMIDSRATTGTDNYSHHVRIDNNTISNFGCAGISLMGDYFTVENNKVFNNSWYSGYGCSGISFFTTRTHDNAAGYHNRIVNNRVWNNETRVKTFKQGKFTDGNGILMDIDYTVGGYKGRTLIANNLVVDNGNSGIVVFEQRHIDIINNTGYLNNRLLSGVGIGAIYCEDVRVLNNISYTGTASTQFATRMNGNKDTVIYDYNLYYSGSDSVATLLGEYSTLRPFIWPVTGKAKVFGANDIVGKNPLFLFPVTDLNDPRLNFRVASNSPAIDKGIIINGVTPTNDARYSARPQGGRTDIGAFEFANAGSFTTQTLPFLNGPSFITTKVGTAVSAQVTNINGASSYSIAGAPTGVSINGSTGVISGTVGNVTKGAYVATVSGTNSFGTSKLRIVFSVDPK